MHYFAVVVVPAQGDVEKHVARIMEPHREEWIPNGEIDEYGDEDGEHTGFWDWYQIGGRFTGRFDDYVPGDDPRNDEKCTTCRGKGTRNDQYVQGVCNGCEGLGRRTKWPTRWARHEGDVIPLSYFISMAEKLTWAEDNYPVPWMLVYEDGTAEKTHFNEQDLDHHNRVVRLCKDLVTDAFNLDEGMPRAVIVDYHC